MIVALGNFFFRYRTTISPLLLALMFLPGAVIVADPFVAAVVGLAVATSGQAVRATTIGLAYIVRGGRGRRVYADALVTQGLFGHVRNPLYVGKFFMVLGAGIAANRWPAAVALCAAYALMYHAVVRAEEAYLRGRFGAAFDEYCRRVPRWLPSVRGFTQTVAGAPLAWSRVLAKEYSAPLGFALPIVAVGLYNMARVAPLAGQRYRAATLASVLAVTVIFWLAAGWLKKRRRRWLPSVDA